MREALAARSDRDFVSRRAPSRRSLAPAAGRLAAAALKRPGAVIGGLIIAGGAIAIAVNALSMQQARHPSPFFAKAERGAASRVGDAAPATLAPPPVAPPPPVRPPDANATGSVPQPPPARAQARDPIGDMIRAAESGPTPSRAAEPRSEPERAVAAAQRALVKLGYGPLKVDGVLGPGTRQAIESFERDRRLPATGELGPRTARELSAQSGIRVE